MSFKNCTVLVLLGMLFAGEDATLDKIITTQYQKYNKIKDIAMTMIAPEIGEIKVMRKGVKSRTEMEMPIKGDKKIPAIIVFDSLEYWMISPVIGKRKISSSEAKIYGEEERWWEEAKQPNIVGDENLNGRDCFVIEYKDENGNKTYRLWVEKKEYLLLKSETTEKKNKFTNIYSDFREVYDDLKMPFKIETYKNGKLVSTITFKEIKVNQNLSDDLFNIDKIEVRQLTPQELMELME
ncbi:MAG: outer membrane lipoprotein-sorting protein [bacterium]|nr:outer membrane lipoprotein-sorting protein [bacterium]